MTPRPVTEGGVRVVVGDVGATTDWGDGPVVVVLKAPDGWLVTPVHVPPRGPCPDCVAARHRQHRTPTWADVDAAAARGAVDRWEADPVDADRLEAVVREHARSGAPDATWLRRSGGGLLTIRARVTRLDDCPRCAP